MARLPSRAISAAPHLQRWVLNSLLSLVSVFVSLAIAELVVRRWAPQPSLSPRWNLSSAYCTLAFPSDRMVHELPGQWRFEYTTNADGHRGRDFELRPTARSSIVVLGDSYAFGVGVNDGEEFPAVMQVSLPSVDVVNLSVGGWGLTQQIRRYYDKGASRQPVAVVLQFSANYPADDLNCPVTELQDGQFKFQDAPAGVLGIKRLLSHSSIQRSQLYNSVRHSIYNAVASRRIRKAREKLASSSSSVPVEDRVYIELLETFVSDLARDRIVVLFLTVDHQLSAFPAIETLVRRLDSEGRLRFIDGADLLQGMRDYSSPEGHLWGTDAHRVIGKELAKSLMRIIEEP